MNEWMHGGIDAWMDRWMNGGDLSELLAHLVLPALLGRTFRNEHEVCLRCNACHQSQVPDGGGCCGVGVMV